MAKEAGPREKALRDMREAKYAKVQTAIAEVTKAENAVKRTIRTLQARIAVASQKTGKSRKKR